MLLQAAMNYDLKGWLLFPTDDESTLLVARHSELLGEQFQLTTPRWDVFRWSYDKRLTYALARDLGLACPWTFCPRSRDDLVSLDCQFPVVLKPAVKQSLNRLTAAKAWRIDDRQKLLARYDEACALVAPETVMVQELVPGSGEAQFSYAGLLKD